MTETDMITALSAQTATITDVPIAWEDVTFTPDQTKPYLRVTNLPVSAQAAGIGQSAPNLVTGIWEILVCTPTGNGTGDADALVERVKALFPRGFALPAGDGFVRSIKPPSRSKPIHTDAWSYYPLNITYFGYAS